MEEYKQRLEEMMTENVAIVGQKEQVDNAKIILTKKLVDMY